MNEFSPKEKSLFLKFVTSCSKPPVGGFQFLEPAFTIRFVDISSSSDEQGHRLGKAIGSLFGFRKDATHLPTAATCFNLLKLPAYSSRSLLKTKLLYAIHSGAGFELS